MIRVIAILETMWNWENQTTNAGYTHAPPFFRINPNNFSGRRLYKLVGVNAQLLVTNACKELVCGPKHHGTPNPEWLAENLKRIESIAFRPHADVLLVCGKIAQKTFKECGYQTKAKVIEIPHPAARTVWTNKYLVEVAIKISKLSK